MAASVNSTGEKYKGHLEYACCLLTSRLLTEQLRPRVGWVSSAATTATVCPALSVVTAGPIATTAPTSLTVPTSQVSNRHSVRYGRSILAVFPKFRPVLQVFLCITSGSSRRILKFGWNKRHSCGVVLFFALKSFTRWGYSFRMQWHRPDTLNLIFE